MGFSKLMAKNNPTKKQIEKKSSNIEACTSVKTDRRENAKFIVKKRTDLHHKLQLLIRICFLLDYLLLFLRLLLLTLSMCLFVGKDIEQKPLLF